MKSLKTGILLIILGNLLYISYICFAINESTNFGKFSFGFLIGLSIGCNLVGIVFTVSYIFNDKSKQQYFLWV